MVIDDTHPDIRRRQFECLRRMTEAERCALAIDLSGTTTWVSREAIRTVMPGATEQQVILRWIELVYGRELAAHVAPLADRLGRCFEPA